MLERELREKIERHIDSRNLRPGDRIPTIEQLRRKTGATRHMVYKTLAQIAEDRKYLVIQGSGMYLPGADRKWRPFEKTVALIYPPGTIEPPVVAGLHKTAMDAGFNLLPLNIPHNDPDYELKTLSFLLERRIWGLIIEPYPGDGANLAAMDRMRANGTRCALLSRPPGAGRRWHTYSLNYRKAGLRAASVAARKRSSRVFFFNSSGRAWHAAEFADGLAEGCRHSDIPLTTFDGARLDVDPVSTEWTWRPRGFSPPLAEGAAYVCDNWNNGACALNNILRRSGLKNFTMIGYSRQRIQGRPPFAMLRFDDEARLAEVLDDILNRPRWPKTAAPILFDPLPRAR